MKNLTRIIILAVFVWVGYTGFKGGMETVARYNEIQAERMAILNY